MKRKSNLVRKQEKGSIESQMGEGKTTTLVAICADRYYSKIKAIVSPDGVELPVEPYKLDTVWLAPPPGSESGKTLIHIPAGWGTISDAKIFTNFRLFGIRHVLCDPITMLSYLNTGVISHGIMGIDEAYIQGDARQGMNTLTRIFTWFGQQIRKRDLELYLLVQHGRFIDWRFRYIAKQKIITRYNEKTHQIKLLIQNLSKGTEKIVHYDAEPYWRFFDTHELPPVPEKVLVKGAEWAA